MASEMQPENAEEENPERIWSHVLVEWSQMDPLCQPISASSRVKYQCIAVSKRYISLGTNTGAIYIFSRTSLQYLDMIATEKEGSVVQVAFSPDDNIFAYATGKGNVVILELRFERRQKPDRLRHIGEHRGCIVTTMKWNAFGNKLYTGDDAGKVSVANISSTLTKKREFFKLPSELIMRLDSSVIQIDCWEDKVVASTHTKTYLCFTSRQQFKHIGSKSRDGVFGASFFHKPKSETCVIYCARPGSRLWECDEEGNVLSTHQFKLLLDIPPLPVVKTWSEKVNYPTDLETGQGPISTNFIQLLNNGEYFVSWNEKYLFVIDPAEGQVILWNDQVPEIQKAVTFKQETYLLFDDNRIRKLELISVAKLVSKLFLSQNYNLCARVALSFQSTLLEKQCRRYVPLSTVMDLKLNLESENENELVPKLEDLIQNIKEVNKAIDSDSATSKNKVSFDKLESGIYMLRQRSVSEVSTGSDDMQVTQSEGDEVSMAEIIEEIGKPVEVQGEDRMKVLGEFERETGVILKVGSTEKNEDLNHSSPKETEEDSVSRDSSSLSRHQSTESLVSLNSLSSNELVFGTPILDPEPVYGQSKTVRKLKGRKAKVTSIHLDGSSKSSEKKITRSQSTSVLDRRSPRPPRKNSTTSAEVAFLLPEDVSQPTQDLKDVTKTPVRKTQSFTDGRPTVVDVGVSTPIVSNFMVPVSSVVMRSKTSDQISLDSFTEDETKRTDNTPTSSSTPDSSPRFGSFRAVKDRISAGMETMGTTVGSKTKSLLLSLKDKTDQLKSKRNELNEPADVAYRKSENSLDARLDESTPSVLGPESSEQLPRVDVSKLEAATKQAKEQLDDLEVQFSHKATSIVLNQWLKCLNETLQNLHIAMLQQGIEEMKKDQHEKFIKSENAIGSLEVENSEPTKTGTERDEGALVNYENTPDREIAKDNVQCSEQCVNEENIQDCATAQWEISSESGNYNDIEIDHSEAQTIATAVKSTIHLEDPFRVSTDFHSDLVKLALLCFQHGLHGCPSRFMSPADQVNEEAGAVFHTGSCKDLQEDTEIMCDGNGEANVELLSSDSEKHNIEMGLLLKCHFHLFRVRIPDVVKVIERRGQHKDRIWDALIECLTELGKEDSVSKQISEGNTEVAFDVLRSGPTLERQCQLSHLKRLFTLYPKNTLEFCAELSREIPVPFVQYLCRQGENPLHYYFFFTKHLLANVIGDHRNKIMMELCSDEESRKSFLEALLKEGTINSDGNTREELHCTCGQPRPGSHKIRWKEQDKLDEALSFSDSHSDKEVQMCKLYGYWRGYLKLLQTLNKLDELLKVTIQLCDVDLLEDVKYGFHLDTIEEWECIFNIKKMQTRNSNGSDQRHQVSCLYCQTEISDPLNVDVTFEDVAVCLVKHVGLSSGLSFLEKVELPEGHLSFKFYQNCVLAASLESRQRIVVHNMLEKLDTYLWSVKPNTIPGQVQAAVEVERKSEKDSSTETLFANLSSRGAIRRSVEEQEVHWGATIDLKSFCLACFLSLQDQVTSDDHGVVVFKCGHTFHKRCFSGRSCVVCTS